MQTPALRATITVPFGGRLRDVTFSMSVGADKTTPTGIAIHAIEGLAEDELKPYTDEAERAVVAHWSDMLQARGLIGDMP